MTANLKRILNTKSCKVLEFADEDSVALYEAVPRDENFAYPFAAEKKIQFIETLNNLLLHLSPIEFNDFMNVLFNELKMIRHGSTFCITETCLGMEDIVQHVDKCGTNEFIKRHFSLAIQSAVFGFNNEERIVPSPNLLTDTILPFLKNFKEFETMTPNELAFGQVTAVSSPGVGLEFFEAVKEICHRKCKHTLVLNDAYMMHVLCYAAHLTKAISNRACAIDAFMGYLPMVYVHYLLWCCERSKQPKVEALINYLTEVACRNIDWAPPEKHPVLKVYWRYRIHNTLLAISDKSYTLMLQPMELNDIRTVVHTKLMSKQKQYQEAYYLLSTNTLNDHLDI